MSEELRNYTLYKIYSEYGIVFIGHAKENLMLSLRDHFFNAPFTRKINIDYVTKIECVNFSSEADLLIYETYYINKLKPALNWEQKAADEVHINLPELDFKEYTCPLMDSWKNEIYKERAVDKDYQKRKEEVEKEYLSKTLEIFGREDILDVEKASLFEDWIINYYEPIRNELL